MRWWRTSGLSAEQRHGASGAEAVAARAIVLDANILVRGVLGSRVPELLAAHAVQATFFAPDIAFDEAREHLPKILAKRGKSAEAIHAALEKLETLARIIVLVPTESYLPFKDRALARIGARDREDWPVLACALAADCAIWTEDTDFFGAGVATWTTASVELFFVESDGGQQDT
jgi:predicted nucleic acid-binding protein